MLFASFLGPYKATSQLVNQGVSSFVPMVRLTRIISLKIFSFSFYFFEKRKIYHSNVLSLQKIDRMISQPVDFSRLVDGETHNYM